VTDEERATLVQQVLDNYLAVQFAADGLAEDPARRLPPLLGGLSTADLRAIAAGFTILAEALRRRPMPRVLDQDGHE
jgi:hypothetical protein